MLDGFEAGMKASGLDEETRCELMVEAGAGARERVLLNQDWSSDVGVLIPATFSADMKNQVEAARVCG